MLHVLRLSNPVAARHRPLVDSRAVTERPPTPDFDSLFQRNLPRLVAFIRARAGKAIALRESAADLAQSVCREVLADLKEFEYPLG